MPSFLTVTLFVPCCGRCQTPAAAAGGIAPQLQSEHLPAELEAFLTAAGWEVTRARHYGHGTKPIPDSLCCPACVFKRAAAEKRFRDSMNLPLTNVIDMAGKIGPGWLIGQRGEPDEISHTWIVKHHSEPAGMIRQYERGDGSWSSGWEAFRNTGSVLHRVDASQAGSWSRKSSFMWRSRGLAAWAVATRPRYEAPLPAWAGRKSKEAA